MILTALYCPKCKDVIYSRVRHDFRTCSCESCAIDGGRDYTKITGTLGKLFALTLNNIEEKDLEKDFSKRLKKSKYGLIKGSGCSYHHWGDGFPFFDDVEEAAYYIGNYLRKWGRMQVHQTKEKFGSARVYLSFGWNNLHDLIFPGYAYCQYGHLFGLYKIRKWFKCPWNMESVDCNWFIRMLAKMTKAVWCFDIYVMSKLIQPLNVIILPYHIWLYRRAYKNAIEKWPHIREEILNSADYYEYLIKE